jgi:uncharacterized membrane protein
MLPLLSAVWRGAIIWIRGFLSLFRDPMSDLRALHTRSWRDTLAQVGQDVVTGVVPALAVLLVVGLYTGNWGFAGVVAVVAAVAVFLPFYLFHLWRNWRHPDQHKFWSLDMEQVYQAHGNPHLYLSIKPRYLMVGGYNCLCSVRSPDKTQYQSRVGATGVEYPRDFEGAPPLVVGVYRVRWLEETKKGKLTPLLEYRREVTEAMMERGAVTSVE